MSRILLAILLLIPCSVSGTEGCQIISAGSWDFLPAGDLALPRALHTSIEVECEAGFDYMIEIANVKAGGLIELNGPEVVLVRLYQGATGSRSLGSEVNGEEIRGTGSNSVQSIPVRAEIQSGYLIEGGAYTARLELNIK